MARWKGYRMSRREAKQIRRGNRKLAAHLASKSWSRFKRFNKR